MEPFLLGIGMTKVYQETLTLRTKGRSLHGVTQEINAVVQESGVRCGTCVIFVQHTSASLLVQENADPDVLVDLERFFDRLVPDGNRADYVHSAEGPDDMPAHIRSALTQTSLTIPVTQGRLALGTWQGIFLWEHRSRSHSRNLLVHVSGIL